METHSRKQGDMVSFTTPLHGIGEIEGVGSVEQPGLGRLWIVKLVFPTPESISYPFTHIMVADAWMKS